jgi:hypothetical protein
MSAQKRYIAEHWYGVWLENQEGDGFWCGEFQHVEDHRELTARRNRVRSRGVYSATIRPVTIPPPQGWEEPKGLEAEA